MKIVVLCDFDGTITRRDTLVQILNRFAPKSWKNIERLIKSGHMGSRVALRKEFSLFYIDKKRYVAFIRRNIKIDPYFKPFLKFVTSRKMRFLILSGWFSLNIRVVLKKYGLGHLPFFANSLVFKNGSFEIKYPNPGNGCRKCGNCKRSHLLKFKKKGYFVIYIGDSTTDRCPVKSADLVFAKWGLAEYCRKRKIPYIPYETFKDIKDHLTRMGADKKMD